MSLLPSPLDCCRPCPSPQVVNVPGTPGTSGADGAPGANGVDAYTTTTNEFTMPAEQADVTVQVLSSLWMAVGQILFFGDPGAAAQGWFQVVSKPDGASVIVKNLANTATAAYTDNSTPGTIFPVSTAVSPGGEQGPAGANGTSGAPDDAKYLIQQADASLPNAQDMSALATGLVKNATGTGVQTVVPLGIAAGNVAPVDAGGPLVAGQVVSAVAGGLKSDTAANQRALLGMGAGAIATQNANSVSITGGAVAGVAITSSTGSFTTLAASSDATLSGKVALAPSLLQTVAAANLITSSSGKIRVVGSGGPIVMTSTPTIALGTIDGQLLLVQGTHDTDTVQLQDNGSLAGSKLRLGAANRTLGAGDSVLLSWDATLGFWVEVAFTSLV